MNCEILETLYVKSNGDVLCNDDAGEQVLLGRVVSDDPSWNIDELFSNSQYSRIRESLSSGLPPWEGICSHCAFLRAEESFADLLSNRQIRKIQIEPSLACNLSCPCCNNANQVRTRPRPFRMDFQVFQLLLSQLSERGYSVEEIEYCGQGEPLMHPLFPNFVDQARRYFPNIRQRLITNGNFDYQRTIQGRYIDEIYVSCDGVFQESYEKYRVGGEVEKAISFMREVPKDVFGRKQTLIWKYILFEFNDGDRELIAAQKLAQSIGVDVLLFVFTHSAYRSQKYLPELAANLPILYPNVATNMTTYIFNRDMLYAKPLSRPPSRFSRWRSSFRAAVDEVSLFKNQVVTIRGWVLSRQKVSSVEVRIDNRPVGSSNVRLPRLDVFEAFPSFDEKRSGFALSAQIEQELVGRHEVTVIAHSDSQRQEKAKFLFDFTRE